MGREVFQYVSMPFGLGPTPRVFTKILKPVVGFLQQQGLRLVVYLDDILIIGSSEVETRKAVKMVVGLFESLGFVIQLEKSITKPSQSLEYIGLVVDTNAMSFSLPLEKKKAFGTVQQSLQVKDIDAEGIGFSVGYPELGISIGGVRLRSL